MKKALDDRLKAEYRAYTCKMLAEFEDKGGVKILGYGEWLDQRQQPERPNEFDNGR